MGNNSPTLHLAYPVVAVTGLVGRRKNETPPKSISGGAQEMLS
jgi:hypothetical protein